MTMDANATKRFEEAIGRAFPDESMSFDEYRGQGMVETGDGEFLMLLTKLLALFLGLTRSSRTRNRVKY